ncbi:hypothetical protein V1477_002002 [Vespula maculifrons]|uniref:Uncharacterized protein n=1 Tax=Vespula maculifrons TaxID=7453 RepID=A0ABD2CXT1_VESMC
MKTSLRGIRRDTWKIWAEGGGGGGRGEGGKRGDWEGGTIFTTIEDISFRCRPYCRRATTSKRRGRVDEKEDDRRRSLTERGRKHRDNKFCISNPYNFTI